MNTKIYLLPLLLLAVLFTSCEETTETTAYDNWQSRNEAFIDSLQNVYDNGLVDTEGRKIERFEIQTAPGTYMLFKRLTPVTATPPVDPVTGEVLPGRENEYIDGYVYKAVQPLYTDIVSVFYKGSLINKVRFDGFTTANPSAFSSLYTTNVFSTDQQKGVISGWTELLQRMNVGDRWEVYIPWQYGYGSSGSNDGSISILGYSTLIFDIQLYSIQ